MRIEVGTDVSDAEVKELVADELLYRKALAAAALSGGTVAPSMLKSSIHKALLAQAAKEDQDIRKNEALYNKNLDLMDRTYKKYLEQGNNPVEGFVPHSRWAAMRDAEGNDIVFFDPSAPDATTLAHELGHVQMNDPSSIDPLSFLQQSRLGKKSGELAPIFGLMGAAGGYAGRPKNRIAGAALGTGIGALLGSGNFAYELGGASGRALGYLPEDVDKVDAAGDLIRAGMTYGMAGPGTAIATGAGLTAALELARRLNRGFS